MRLVRKSKPLPRLVIVLGVVSLLTDLSSEMILPLLPTLLIGTLGAGPIVVGLVDGIADAISAVLKLVAGRLSDRARRRKPFVVAGYGLSTIVRPLVSVAAAPWHVIAVRAVDRVGKGVRSAPRDALIADVVDNESSTRAYAYHRMMDHAGAVLGPLVAALLLAVGLSAREAIAAAWVPGALAVLALIVFAREPPRADSPPEATTAATERRSAPVPLSSDLRRFLVIVGLFSIGVLADSFVLVRARELGTPDALLPIIWSVLHIAKVIAAAVIGRGKNASVPMLAAAWLAVAAGIALLAMATSDVVVLVWIGAVVAGAGHGAREPLEKAIVRARAPADAHGKAFGSYHLVTGLCALPAGLGVGLLWQQRLLHSVLPDVDAGRLALFASAAVVVVAAAILGVSSRAGVLRGR